MKDNKQGLAFVESPPLGMSYSLLEVAELLVSWYTHTHTHTLNSMDNATIMEVATFAAKLTRQKICLFLFNYYKTEIRLRLGTGIRST